MGNAKARLPAAAADGVRDRTDGWLLERFAVQRDEAAFAALMQRHGPLVLCACRRVLQHEQDAEDAFQATFLVLARKAPQLSHAKTVGPWLYSVAGRIANKARVSRVRKQLRETVLQDVAEPERTPDWVWRDLRRVIDEEIDRLPAIYRQLFVFCYIQGETNDSAARQLDCPRGTVLSRLARARERLRSRLSQRGVDLSAGLLASLGSEQTASATVPAELSEASIRAAVHFAGSVSVTTGTIPPKVATLAEAVLKSSAQTRSKIAALLALAMGVALAITLVLFLGLTALRLLPSDREADAAQQAAKMQLAERHRFEGTWRVLRAEFDRQRLGLDNLPVNITGDRWTLTEKPVSDRITLDARESMPGREATARQNVIIIGPIVAYTTDASKDPKTIDLIFAGGRRALGIYAMEGDRMTLCYRMAGRGRPTEYTPSHTSQTFLFHFQREPSAEGPGRMRNSDLGG